MKVFGRALVMPILVHKTSAVYGGEPNFSLRWNKSVMDGSMKTASYTLEIRTKASRWQWSFVWRPDVTRYWLATKCGHSIRE